MAVPRGVVVDSQGNMLISDTGNYRIRLVAAVNCSAGCPFGLPSMVKDDIYTIAGDGVPGFAGDGAAAVDAELYDPVGVTVGRGGGVYIADHDNQRVRLLTGGPTTSSETSARRGPAGPRPPARLRAPALVWRARAPVVRAAGRVASRHAAR